LPAAPDDVEPGAGEDAHGVRMVVAAGSGFGVEAAAQGLPWCESPAKSMTASRSCLSTAHRNATILTVPARGPR
jgi:hypothetical protein